MGQFGQLSILYIFKVNLTRPGTYWIENPILEEKFNLPRGEYDIPLTLNDGIYDQDGKLWNKVKETPSGVKKQWLYPQEDIKSHVEVNSMFSFSICLDESLTLITQHIL